MSAALAAALGSSLSNPHACPAWPQPRTCVALTRGSFYLTLHCADSRRVAAAAQTSVSCSARTPACGAVVVTRPQAGGRVTRELTYELPSSQLLLFHVISFLPPEHGCHTLCLLCRCSWQNGLGPAASPRLQVGVLRVPSVGNST